MDVGRPEGLFGDGPPLAILGHVLGKQRLPVGVMEACLEFGFLLGQGVTLAPLALRLCNHTMPRSVSARGGASYLAHRRGYKGLDDPDLFLDYIYPVQTVVRIITLLAPLATRSGHHSVLADEEGLGGPDEPDVYVDQVHALVVILGLTVVVYDLVCQELAEFLDRTAQVLEGVA